MREPGFWWRSPSLTSRLLAPLGSLYGAVAAQRMTRSGHDAGIPVICVGNYHVGGAGKTPAVMTLIAMLRAAGERPFVLSRGYGGRKRGPVSVDPAQHGASDVGDEPLLLARAAPVIVARDRVAGADAARAARASVIVMDDGFQNPALLKTISLIVIDGERGAGNGGVFPAGPLRAPLAAQIARTDALIVVGRGVKADGIAAQVAARGGLVMRAEIKPDPPAVAALRGRRVLAFAGIGDPARFFSTLRDCGIDVAATRMFPDHHPYKRAEIERLKADAKRDGLSLVTTEKDFVRLGLSGDDPDAAIDTLPVTMDISNPAALRDLMQQALAAARRKPAIHGN